MLFSLSLYLAFYLHNRSIVLMHNVVDLFRVGGEGVIICTMNKLDTVLIQRVLIISWVRAFGPNPADDHLGLQGLYIQIKK